MYLSIIYLSIYLSINIYVYLWSTVYWGGCSVVCLSHVAFACF